MFGFVYKEIWDFGDIITNLDGEMKLTHDLLRLKH